MFSLIGPFLFLVVCVTVGALLVVSLAKFVFAQVASLGDPRRYPEPPSPRRMFFRDEDHGQHPARGL
jgi:hypothetical protein